MNQTETLDQIIKIPIPNTKFFVLGTQQPFLDWNIYLVDPKKNYKELLRKHVTTQSLSTFSIAILKKELPIKTTKT